MGGGEVARHVANHGEERLRSVVFAAAVPPCLMKSEDNQDGPLTPEKAKEKEAAFKADPEAYFEDFTRNFFSANDVLKVSEAQRQDAIDHAVRQPVASGAFHPDDDHADDDCGENQDHEHGEHSWQQNVTPCGADPSQG